MKCLPIIFGIDVKDDFPIFFGCFYKFIYYCKINNWPILAQQEYFIDPKFYEEKFNINLKQVAKINEIPKISKLLFDNVDKYIITDEDTDKVLSCYKNKDEAWIGLMNRSNLTLFEILDNFLLKITKKHKDIKSVLLWRHNKTICDVAKKYGLNVIEMELSGVRKPDYNFGLCYFQYSNKYSTKELNSRYKVFCKELSNKKFPFLTRNELINLLLSKKSISNIKEEEYDVGIALGLRNDYETFSTNSITNDEILENLQNFEHKKNVLIRKHPANHDYKYNHEELYCIDNSVSSIEFISKCRKIVSSVSNIGLEAMILGKTSYTLGKMPFSRFCYTSLDYNDEYVVNMRDLNFLIFCYYTPYSLALTQEYIEFRNSDPSQYDIYMCHYNYIMKNNKNDLMKRNFSVRNNYLTKSKKIKNLNNSIVQLNSELEVCKNKNNKIVSENQFLRNEIDNIINSKSWKITKILRVINKKKK